MGKLLLCNRVLIFFKVYYVFSLKNISYFLNLRCIYSYFEIIVYNKIVIKWIIFLIVSNFVIVKY